MFQSMCYLLCDKMFQRKFAESMLDFSPSLQFALILFVTQIYIFYVTQPVAWCDVTWYSNWYLKRMFPSLKGQLSTQTGLRLLKKLSCVAAKSAKMRSKFTYFRMLQNASTVFYSDRPFYQLGLIQIWRKKNNDQKLDL